jgi:hypothetical protein
MEAAIMASTILQFVLTMTWTCLKDTPSIQKNVLFAQYIPSLAVLQEIASTTSLTFTPGLFEILQAAFPPTIEYFKTSPTDTLRCWAVYVLTLEKPDCPPKLYIGSGAEGSVSLYKRFQHYDTLISLPYYVEKTIKEGYEIVHKAPLCWISIPSASLLPKLRLLFVTLEATFSYMLWAMRTVSKEYVMAHICLWDRSTFEYEGLCSHCSLNEGIAGDFCLSAEDLEAQAVEKKAARTLYQAEYGSNWHFKQMETNHKEYLAGARERGTKARAKSPERVNKRNRDWHATALEEERYYGETCKIAFCTKHKLKEHNDTARHLQKEEEMKNPHRCIPCAYAGKRKQNLTDHCKTKRHEKIMAALSSSQLD